MEALTNLIAQWRERGLRVCPDVEPPRGGWTTQQHIERPMGAVLLHCADELEAALAGSAAIPSSPSHSKTDEVISDGTALPVSTGVATAPTDEAIS